MPCSNPKHHHEWPKTGMRQFRINACETVCGWCSYSTPHASNLRVHVRRHLRNRNDKALKDIKLLEGKPGRARVASQSAESSTFPSPNETISQQPSTSRASRSNSKSDNNLRQDDSAQSYDGLLRAMDVQRHKIIDLFRARDDSRNKIKDLSGARSNLLGDVERLSQERDDLICDVGNLVDERDLLHKRVQVLETFSRWHGLEIPEPSADLKALQLHFGKYRAKGKRAPPSPPESSSRASRKLSELLSSTRSESRSPESHTQSSPPGGTSFQNLPTIEKYTSNVQLHSSTRLQGNGPSNANDLLTWVYTPDPSYLSELEHQQSGLLEWTFECTSLR